MIQHVLLMLIFWHMFQIGVTSHQSDKATKFLKDIHILFLLHFPSEFLRKKNFFCELIFFKGMISCSALQLLEELHLRDKQQLEMQKELEMHKELLKSERQTLRDLTCDYDKLKALCDEKDSALQVISCELTDTTTFF